MRLDKFLFFARITKTRARAQAVIAEGHIRIDGRRIAGSHPTIATGQTVTLPVQGGVRALRILALPHRRGPAREAQSCYCDATTQTPIDEAPTGI